MTWITTITAFHEFQNRVVTAPDSVRVDGIMRGRRIALTLATLLEERPSFFVESITGHWKAHVFCDRSISIEPRSYLVRSQSRNLGNPSQKNFVHDVSPRKNEGRGRLTRVAGNCR